MIVVCAWCGKVRDGEDGEWREPADGDSGEDISHGICDDCFDEQAP